MISVSALTLAKNSSKHNQAIHTDVTIDKVYVDKSERVLKLLSGDRVIKTYHIALGDSPVGHKRQEGDERTPTGSYILDYKNENSSKTPEKLLKPPYIMVNLFKKIPTARNRRGVC